MLMFIKACLIIRLTWVTGVHLLLSSCDPESAISGLKSAVGWGHRPATVSERIQTMMSGSIQIPDQQLVQPLRLPQRVWASCSHPVSCPALQWALEGQNMEKWLTVFLLCAQSRKKNRAMCLFFHFLLIAQINSALLSPKNYWPVDPVQPKVCFWEMPET